MKHLLSFLFLALFLSNARAQNTGPQAYVDFGSFYDQESGFYLESYLSFIGKSLAFEKNASGKYQAKVELTLVVKKDSLVADFRKLILSSPEIADSGMARPNFIDQQRMVLAPGNYRVHLGIRDLNRPDTSLTANSEIQIGFPDTSIQFSTIQFLEQFLPAEKQGVLSKNGFDLIPYVSDFFPMETMHLSFYCEVYFSEKKLPKAEDFLIRYSVESAETGVALADYHGFSRAKAGPVNAVLKKISIENLPSGNYFLVLEVRDKANQTIAKQKRFFQRSNPAKGFQTRDIASIDINRTFLKDMNHRDSLRNFLLCLYPIADPADREIIGTLSRSQDMQLQKQFFYNFWLNRNAIDPQREWFGYRQKVEMVDREFGSQIREGYATDPGRVFLQYGPPDVRTVSKNEPGYKPYEIWQYYQLQGQRNIKFVFYNPEQTGTDFTLIYSNLRGEVMRDDWENLVRSDDRQKNESFGDRFRTNFLDPK